MQPGTRAHDLESRPKDEAITRQVESDRLIHDKIASERERKRDALHDEPGERQRLAGDHGRRRDPSARLGGSSVAKAELLRSCFLLGEAAQAQVAKLPEVVSRPTASRDRIRRSGSCGIHHGTSEVTASRRRQRIDMDHAKVGRVGDVGDVRVAGHVRGAWALGIATSVAPSIADTASRVGLSGLHRRRRRGWRCLRLGSPFGGNRGARARRARRARARVHLPANLADRCEGLVYARNRERGLIQPRRVALGKAIAAELFEAHALAESDRILAGSFSSASVDPPRIDEPRRTVISGANESSSLLNTRLTPARWSAGAASVTAVPSASLFAGVAGSGMSSSPVSVMAARRAARVRRCTRRAASE